MTGSWLMIDWLIVRSDSWSEIGDCLVTDSEAHRVSQSHLCIIQMLWGNGWLSGGRVIIMLDNGAEAGIWHWRSSPISTLTSVDLMNCPVMDEFAADACMLYYILYLNFDGKWSNIAKAKSENRECWDLRVERTFDDRRWISSSNR